MIVIDETGDLTVKVIEHEDRPGHLVGLESRHQESVYQPRIISKTEDFQVCRQVLIDNSSEFAQLTTSKACRSSPISTAVLTTHKTP